MQSPSKAVFWLELFKWLEPLELTGLFQKFDLLLDSLMAWQVFFVTHPLALKFGRDF